MEMLNPGPLGFSCEETRALMERIALGDQSINRAEADAYTLHLAVCPGCAKAFYLAAGMNEDGTLKAEEQCRFDAIAPALMTAEEGWQDLLRRCPDLSEAEHQNLHKARVRWWMGRHIIQAVTLAACLVLVLGFGKTKATWPGETPALPDETEEG